MDSNGTHRSPEGRTASERILVIDGAMGTAIQSLRPRPRRLWWHRLRRLQRKPCTDPARTSLRAIHRGHLDAGADIIETDTFGSTSIVLAEYDLGPRGSPSQPSRRGTGPQCGRRRDHTPEKPRFVAGSMGPTTKTISVTGGVTFDELVDSYQDAGRRADGGRRGCPPAGDWAGHPEHQGRASRA